MPSFQETHFDLLGLAEIFEPATSYRFDYSFGSINENLLYQEEAPETIELDDITPWFWYTQYWATCTLLRQCANLDGYEFREICDYTFEDDETIYTGHPLDLY